MSSPIGLRDGLVALSTSTSTTLQPSFRKLNDCLLFAPVLEAIDGPVNGSLTANADGTLSYQPTANFHGPDSFSYRYTVNGPSSNIATVNLTVRSVNHAPTVPDLDGTIMAGKPFTFDPLAGAFDIEGGGLNA